MFDSTKAFEAQFTPVDDGFLFYPSRKGGGKLITAAEYQGLLEAWRRRASPWKLAIGTLVLFVIWIALSKALALPEWSENLFMVAVVAGVCSWIIWAAYAPRRLVRDRSEVAPPRSLSEVRRNARAALNWPIISFVLLVCGAILLSKLIAPENTVGWWAWAVGSGVMFSAYVWIAVLKFRDSARDAP